MNTEIITIYPQGPHKLTWCVTTYSVVSIAKAGRAIRREEHLIAPPHHSTSLA